MHSITQHIDCHGRPENLRWIALFRKITKGYTRYLAPRVNHNLYARLGLVSLSMSIALAGCAERDKATDVDASHATVTPYAGQPIVLRHAVGAIRKNERSTDDAVHHVATGDGQSLGNQSSATDFAMEDALAYFNTRRSEVGLPPIMQNAAVAEAAAAHTLYLIKNSEVGHTERQGNAAFTGTDVASRLRMHLPVNGASEVLTRFGSNFQIDEAIRQLFASPYHRGVILFDWQLGGVALERANDSVMVVDFANTHATQAENELVAYPYDGQTDVPTRWINNEVPDPLGDETRFRGQAVGFPITLSGGPNAHIAWRRATLTDASGHATACRIAPLRTADSARNTAICTPLAPLKAETHYRMEAVGLLTQLSRFATVAPFSLQWSFSTGD